MNKKIISGLKNILYSFIAVLSITAFLYVFGNKMSLLALNCVTNNKNIYLKSNTVSDQTALQSGFEENFLQYTNVNNNSTAQLMPLNNTVSESDDSIAVNLSALSGKYTNYGGTSVINNTDYNVTDLLYDNYALPKLNKEEPYILIYHTHTSEGYKDGGTVVDVGNELASEFEKLGYKTIHLTTVFDKEQFSGAYSRSIKGVEEVLKKYPSIKLAFDVHRDAITDSNGVEYRPLTTVDDKTCAQVMFVCGTDEKGLSHPNWKQNFKFALDVSRTMGSLYGSLSRPVNLRGDRFNTHVTNHAFIMEIGSAANTLSEAKNAAVYTARSVIKTIEKES